MGYFSGAFFSKTLEMDTQLGVILPHDSRKHNGYEDLKTGVTPSAKPRTLLLLHGLGDNYLAWQARTSVLRYAEEYDIAVLMPECARSWYQDMTYGRKYFTYITEELPEYAAKVFNISVDPESLMIAGLSMGGYGALRCGLTYPERYAGIAAFSSAWDIERLCFREELSSPAFGMDEFRRDRKAAWGDATELPKESSIPELIANVSPQKLPKLYIACGKDDFLKEDHERLRNMLDEKEINYKNTDLPGIHEWAVWDRTLQQTLDYFIRDIEPAEVLE